MSELPAGGMELLRDRLTGLPGVDAARLRLREWFEGAEAAGRAPAVHGLLLGLRRFDTVNLAFGAAAGDSALAEVAQQVSHFAASELEGPWVAARSGGGNFLLVAREECSRERWQLFAEQLADRVAKPIPAASGMLRLSPRVVMVRALAGESVDAIIDRLGETLERMKRHQGRRVAWADGEVAPIGATAARIEADLLAAIDRDEIELLYQPQYALPGGRMSGAEALSRWRHPRFGSIGAGTLFAIAERADHVVPLSRHIAARALATASRWPNHLRLSLNVTPADLAAGSYGRDLIDLIRESRMPPSRLTLEVTEQALLHDASAVAPMLGELAANGIRIALDDFGAGFCNFRYLKVLPLHYLKLDRSMVDGITGDPRDLAVLRAILAMARALDLEVIAEGIESEAQLEVITAEGCDYFQGFLRARPMSATEFEGLGSSTA